MDLIQITFGGLLGALLAGAGVYLTLGRTAMSKADHDKECTWRTAPIFVEINHLKERVKELKDTTDDSSQKIDEVLVILRKGK